MQITFPKVCSSLVLCSKFLTIKYEQHGENLFQPLETSFSPSQHFIRNLSKNISSVLFSETYRCNPEITCRFPHLWWWWRLPPSPAESTPTQGISCRHPQPSGGVCFFILVIGHWKNLPPQKHVF